MSTPIVGVMFRGRVRKFCLEVQRNVLVENAESGNDVVRFGIPAGEDSTQIQDYIRTIAPDAQIQFITPHIANPVLSKLNVNVEERYSL